MKVLAPILFLMSVTAIAGPLKGTWHFKRTDGVIGTVKLSGDYPSCTVYPAGKDINISVSIEKVNLQSPSCFQQASPDSTVKGVFRHKGGQLADGSVHFGKNFDGLMESFKKFGPDTVGPIGNNDQFPCPTAATAFLTIDGFVVGDPNENIGGYCLVP